MSEFKDGIYVYVTGTVSRISTTQTGKTITNIEVQSEHRQYPDRLTVWGEVPASEGDKIKLKGWLSWSKSENDGKTYFNVSVNNPEVVDVQKSGIQTATFEDSAPF